MQGLCEPVKGPSAPAAVASWAARSQTSLPPVTRDSATTTSLTTRPAGSCTSRCTARCVSVVPERVCSLNLIFTSWPVGSCSTVCSTGVMSMTCPLRLTSGTSLEPLRLGPDGRAGGGRLGVRTMHHEVEALLAGGEVGRPTTWR